MSKKPKQDNMDIPARVIRLRAEIEPAFRVRIVDDSTGKSWSGHTWYGDTAMQALRKAKTTMHMGDYRHDDVKISTSTPQRAAAISWKEEVYE